MHLKKNHSIIHSREKETIQLSRKMLINKITTHHLHGQLDNMIIAWKIYT